MLGSSACGSEEPAVQSAEPTTVQAAEPTEETTEDPQDGGEEPEPSLGPLDEDQLMDLLVSSADLPAPPTGHSTHVGLGYFTEFIAVAHQDYRETFGENECTTAMDTINVELIGGDPVEGLVHEFQLPREETGEARLYVWALSYEREVDSARVWDQILQGCEGGLDSPTDTVTIDPLNAEGFTGVSLDMRSERDGVPPRITGYSATADAGHNLVMMSSVGLTEEEFLQVAAAQAAKIDQALSG